ncbi:MAG: crossover junction endodeoxyribonuclease RuvC, partial [Myxococcota bacterium]
MLAFGIDPGSRFTGWGVIAHEGSRYEMVDCGVLAVGERRPLADRLRDIHLGLEALLERHAPDDVFLESIFHHKSARSALVLGHARGVALLACGLRELPLVEISPSLKA